MSAISQWCPKASWYFVALECDDGSKKWKYCVRQFRFLSQFEQSRVLIKKKGRGIEEDLAQQLNYSSAVHRLASSKRNYYYYWYVTTQSCERCRRKQTQDGTRQVFFLSSAHISSSFATGGKYSLQIIIIIIIKFLYLKLAEDQITSIHNYFHWIPKWALFSTTYRLKMFNFKSQMNHFQFTINFH